ncbi:MAG TPA: CHAD domain-containing protein [Planctomycetota bacterium]|nr:CHAD domain-containing protein [Planctomycetota bacterium]
MLEVPSNALSRPPEEVSRLLGLSFLEDARGAAERLGRGNDPEALHDFRVALRRLRSCLGAYRPQMKDSISKKLRKRLRDLAHATSSGRDTEVQLEWLKSQKCRLAPAEEPGFRWLLNRLRRRKKSAYGSVLDVVTRDFERLETSFSKKLSTYRTEVSLEFPAPGPPFRHVAGSLVGRHGEELVVLLGAIGSASDVRVQHEARIAAKRLRYLLEPLVQTGAGGPALIEELKGLQDLLGDLRDTHVLLDEMASSRKEAAARAAPRSSAAVDRDAGTGDSKPRSDPLPGLDRLTAFLEERGAELFEKLHSGWLEGKETALFEHVHAFAGGLLEAEKEKGSPVAATSQPVEIERKYLLSALPDAVNEAEPVEIDQGWLPGKILRERVRRVREGGRESYYRTMKMGQGIERIQLEERTTRKTFEALWPLTKGHRIRKRRHRVSGGDLVWEIDEFQKDGLVIAEVELPSRDAPCEIPPWLAPHLVREVTGEPEYLNENLAR